MTITVKQTIRHITVYIFFEDVLSCSFLQCRPVSADVHCSALWRSRATPGALCVFPASKFTLSHLQEVITPLSQTLIKFSSPFCSDQCEKMKRSLHPTPPHPHPLFPGHEMMRRTSGAEVDARDGGLLVPFDLRDLRARCCSLVLSTGHQTSP